MPKVVIDGKEYDVSAGKTVLQVCLENGINVPYFCYHPKLSIAGNCRMCLVEVEGARKPVISCNEYVRDGMIVRTNTPTVLEDRKSVLEFILINHPLDCPICDQAGECDLQDQYFDHSAVPYRFREEKVHKPKAVPLGDLVTLDDERCIVCTRCVRFCDEIPKTHELCVAERGDRSTITTFEGQGMQNAYSVNTVDICPVGALTSRDFRFNKRVWFLANTKSVCAGCATGCNTWLDHEGGVVYRYRPRENEAVNQHWMCDEGRLSYKFINAPDRIDAPYVRAADAGWERTTWDAALRQLELVCHETPAHERGVVLSAQCSNEENFAWWWLAHEHWKTVHLFGTKRTPANPSEDEILRHRDKNPNSACLKILQATKSMAAGPRLLFVLDTLPPEEVARLQENRPHCVVVLATNWGTHPFAARWTPLADARAVVGIQHTRDEGRPSELCSRSSLVLPWADLVLPLATFAEQSGHFTNAKGLVQPFDRAFPPRADAQPAWAIAQRVARMESAALPWADAPAIAAAIAAQFPALQCEVIAGDAAARRAVR